MTQSRAEPTELTTPPDAASRQPALVAFVLQQARIKHNMCNLQARANGYTLELRRISDYNFVYVEKGRVTWRIEGEDYPLARGDLLFVPPGPVHSAWSNTRRMRLISIHLDAVLPSGRDVFNLLEPPTVQRVPGRSRLEGYLKGLLSEFERPNRDCRLTQPPWVTLFAMEVLRSGAASNSLQTRPIDPVVARLIEELPSYLSQNVRLADLAKKAGYSPQHLNRLFQKYLGVTPLKHLARLRVDRAAQLLQEGQLTIAAVAQAVGFDDAYYFSRFFREQTGRSPSELRHSGVDTTRHVQKIHLPVR